MSRPVAPALDDPNRPFNWSRFVQFTSGERRWGQMHALSSSGASVSQIELAVDVEKDVSALIHRVMLTARLIDSYLKPRPDDPKIDLDDMLNAILMMCHEEISADQATKRFPGLMWARGPLPRQVIWYSRGIRKGAE